MKFIYVNGDILECEYKNNKPNGKGKRTLANGKIFYGEWKDGKLID